MFKVEVWDGHQLVTVPVLDVKTNLPNSLPLWSKINLLRYNAKTFCSSVYINELGVARICETPNQSERLVIEWVK